MAHEAQVRYSNLVDLKLRKTLVKKVAPRQVPSRFPSVTPRLW